MYPNPLSEKQFLSARSARIPDRRQEDRQRVWRAALAIDFPFAPCAELRLCVPFFLTRKPRGPPFQDVGATVGREVLHAGHLAIGFQSQRTELLELGQRK